MKKGKISHIGAVAMATMLAVQSMGSYGSVLAADKPIVMSSDSNTQMSSEKETVYVNRYGSASERTQNFDSNWKFYLGDASGAENPTFDDSQWRQLSLPHDYSIEQEYTSSGEAESGYLLGGTGWYRKNFTIGEDMKDKRVRIDFDGVYMNSTVYVNGKQVGTHPYGYTPFSFDITEHVKFGQENTIAVKVDHQTPSSRWYSGSGIYRSVHLTTTDKVHVDLNGVKVETPKLAEENQDTKISTTVRNESDKEQAVTVKHTMFEKGKDKSVGTATTESKTVPAGQSVNVDATMKVSGVKLWSLENPNLYTVRTEVVVGKDVVDTYETDYGFRYFSFDTEKGFSLNGKNVKLKGVCMHHDQGALGAVANRRAIERQVEILQEMGCNSIRVTHNPAAQDLIDICNEKGILVVEEVFDGWHYKKNGNSEDFSKYFDKQIGGENSLLDSSAEMTWAEFSLKAILRRDQNAPSVIMWSLGNEIQEGTYKTGFLAKAPSLIEWAQQIDKSRPLTIGSNAVKGESASGEHSKIADLITKAGGVSGTNYSDANSYKNLHKMHPEWKLYGSETASSINSRGIYKRTSETWGVKPADKQLSSYDQSKVDWGAYASAAWYDVIQNDFVAGEYVWTGFDYIGEPTPWNGTDPGAQGAWPSPKNSYFGIVDTAGFPKDSYYFYQSQWNDNVRTLHVLPTWNEDSLKKDKDDNVEVVVYSDAAKVELYLNDELVDTQNYKKTSTEAGYTYQTVDGQNGHKSMYMTFKVPYKKGTLKAVAYDESGKVIKDTKGRSVVTTTDKEAKLSVSTDRKEITADGKDLSYVTVDVTDKDGNIVPDAKNRVKIKVEGAGTLVGVDNGSSPDHDSYKIDNREAFSGKMLAIVQSTKKAGNIKVTATADGLESAVVDIVTKPSKEQNTEKYIESFQYSKVYYVKTGMKPNLPTKIKANYSDGTSKDVNVKWADITDDQISKTGSFLVAGTTENCNISVTVNMIEDVAKLLNYSTTTTLGKKPDLPTTRPAVLSDGTILSVAFPVKWNEKAESEYGKVDDIVTVDGVADVFGKQLKVAASVRVAEGQISIGNSVTGSAHLSQDINGSDTLEAIKDGSTGYQSIPEGANKNPSVWSNYEVSQLGTKSAELTFKFDTQVRVGEVVIHFAKDTWSMNYPKAGTTEIYAAGLKEGEKWTKIKTTETIGDAKSNVKAYVYKIDPLLTEMIKVKVTNTDEVVNPEAKPCTGITEVELKEFVRNYNTNATAKLAEVKIGGKAIPKAALSLSSYSTPETDASKVEAKAADNAALTVLPVKDKVIRMIIESEDHNTRNKFEVRLDEEESILPGDASKDYPVGQMEATAESVYAGTGNEGPVKYVLDGKHETYWHTNWSTDEATKEDKRAVILEMKPVDGEKYPTLDALRYLRRQGNSKNGAVTEYKVECSMDKVTWETVSTGNWDKDNADWQIALFSKPVQARYVRLTGVHTYADSGNDAHMSVAELRVRTTNDEAVPGTTEIYDPSKTTATAGSAQPNFESEKALDDNMETWWHSSWNPEGDTLADDLRWFQLELDQEQTITKLIYTPRNGNSEDGGEKNGAVTKYRVECSVDGKTWKSVSEGEWPVEDGSKEAVLKTPTKAKFVRLVGVETFGVGGQNNKYMSAAEVRIEVQTGETPQPTPKEFTVTFNIDGTNQVVKVEDGKTIGDKLPANPTKKGHKFVGWNTKADGTGTEVTSETKVDKDMIVYAVFEKNMETIDVIFDVDGTITVVTVEKGTAIGEQFPADPVKEGYVFKGWNSAQDGTGTELRKDTVVSDNMTVYAVFEEIAKPNPEAKEVTITFDVDGTTTVVIMEAGTAIGDRLPADPVKEGSMFKGWNTKADGTGTVVTKDTVAEENMTVYAIFEKQATPSAPDQKPNKPDQSNGIKTGDQISMAAVVGIFAVAVVAVVTIVVIINKKRKK